MPLKRRAQHCTAGFDWRKYNGSSSLWLDPEEELVIQLTCIHEQIEVSGVCVCLLVQSLMNVVPN